ncbi:hypothetical protein H0H92_001741 [Tricholoma furcatifolium]|nr:hypothetical protein H0H92_001741 [Tricholoma furcatifolium]
MPRPGHDAELRNITRPITVTEVLCSEMEATRSHEALSDVFAACGYQCWSMVIGINKYNDVDVPDLKGAVADADAISEFLLRIHVPQDRIVNLRDEEATRKAILQAISDIAANDLIGTQDPILIYFSGHGSETRPPRNWATSTSNQMIQMILPCDFSSKGSQHQDGQGIFDMNLNQIFEKISKKKSDNITVVLDCCHSGSGTRNPYGQTLARRGVQLPASYTIPEHVWMSEFPESSGQRARCRPSKDTGLSTHVLLAACKQGQCAVENNGRGAFTVALISILQQKGIELTYKDIIACLPALPMQNPQCEGINQDRMLFSSKIYGSRPPRMYEIHANPTQVNEYTLYAGELHGVMAEAKFSVYYDKSMTTPIGSVVVTAAHAHTSQCSAVNGTSFLLSQPAYAVQTRFGKGPDLRVFVPHNTDFQKFHLRLHEEMGRSRFFHLVDVDDHPDLILDVHDGLVSFEIRDPICRQYDLTHMTFDGDIRPDDSEDLLSILRSAAHFYWHLRHSGKDSHLINNIQFECFELESSVTDGIDVFVPKDGGKNLITDDKIVLEDDQLGIELPYGFRVTNSLDDPLYAALFYFDMSDLAITAYHIPGYAAKGNVDLSIPGKGSLPIGFGDSGCRPRTYNVEPPSRIDIGFVKLYVFTKYIDLSDISQKSPIPISRKDKPFKKERKEYWGTLTIPIIQRRDS